MRPRNGCRWETGRVEKATNSVTIRRDVSPSDRHCRSRWGSGLSAQEAQSGDRTASRVRTVCGIKSCRCLRAHLQRHQETWQMRT